MANPGLLKGRARRNSWGGVCVCVPSQRVSAEVFHQCKFTMGEKSTEEMAAEGGAATRLPCQELPAVASQPQCLLCGLHI